MCAVSMVMDHGLSQWQNTSTLPNEYQIKFWKQWQELVEKARKYDEMTAQPNCEDPKKAEFEKKVLERLAHLEQRINAVLPPAHGYVFGAHQAASNNE